MRRLGIAKAPSGFETALVTTPVPVCWAATSAPGMTAPEESTTVPDSVCVVEPWAYAAALIAQNNAASRIDGPTRNTLRFID